MSVRSMEDTSDISSSIGVSAERSSDHTATAGSFKRRKLVRQRALVSIPNEETVSTYLNAFVRDHSQWAWTKTKSFKDCLLKALKEKQKKEPVFDEQLYDTWKQFFAESHNYVILWFNETKESESHKAIGLARQLSKGDLAFLKGRNIGVSTARSSNDHCVVVLSRDDVTDPWDVKYCTSIVEIKMLDTSICLIAKGAILRDLPDLKKSGPIVQSIGYLSTLVWPSLVHMRCPQRRAMRITAIAGERPTQADAAFENARFISGSYIAPENCGEQFKYKIDSFASAKNDPQATSTLYEYLRNVEAGFKIAFQYWNRKNPPVAMAPVGGLDLPEKILTFCSMQNIQPTLIGTPAETVDLKVGQGDVWEMKASPKDLSSIITNTIIPENPSEEDEEMLLKVSSEAAFATWIAPHDSMSALTELYKANVSLGCLLGFQMTSTGMVTIMEDLRVKNFETLSPANHNLSSLWRALHTILEDTFIPAARLGIVHADIRAGYDSTANLLCCCNTAAVITLKLIDFDSFCTPDVIPTHDKRALNCHNAMSYLFLQVCLLGHTWQKRTNQGNVEGQLFSDEALRYGIDDSDTLPEQSIMMVWKYFDSNFANSTFSCTNEETEAMTVWRKGKAPVVQEQDDWWVHEIFSAVGICSKNRKQMVLINS